MLNRNILVALVLAGATLAPVASFAATSSSVSPPCVFKRRHVVSVAPYMVEERPVKTTFKRLAGAQLTIEAEPGLTAEWLRLEIARHLDQMRDPALMNGCVLDVGDVRVDVESVGTGFAVKLIAVDRSRAEEVLQRARTLLG
jgi:hypothetical protein